MNDAEWGHRFGKDALRHRHMIERHPLGATVAGHLAVEAMQRQAQSGHHPLHMAVALQFWAGDMALALRLARLLADIEPVRRTDFTLILAARFDVERTKELRKTEIYCNEKFPVMFLKSKRIATGHPDGCFGLWAGTLENCYEGLLGGAPFDNVAMIEADGVPARFDWIDIWKKRHQFTLDSGKFVTGARMEGNEMYESHINGACMIHVPWWAATPSLHSCPKGIAYDCYHGPTMLAASSQARAVCNLYGAHSLSLSVYKTLGRDYAWIASVKDDSAYRCARTLIPEAFKKLHESAWGRPKKERKRHGSRHLSCFVSKPLRVAAVPVSKHRKARKGISKPSHGSASVRAHSRVNKNPRRNRDARAGSNHPAAPKLVEGAERGKAAGVAQHKRGRGVLRGLGPGVSEGVHAGHLAD